MNNRIEIDLGFAKLAVEQGTHPDYPREVYVGLEKGRTVAAGYRSHWSALPLWG